MTADLNPANEVIIHRKWQEIAGFIEDLNLRTSEDPDAFPVHSSSTLAGDDRASSPFRVSVALRSCLNSGVDHLHALKSLVTDAGLLHLAAPFSLVRGSLETFSAATWLLAGTTRAERVERALRWHAASTKDGHRAMGEFHLPGARPVAQQWARLDEVADRSALGRRFHGGYRSSDAVKSAEAMFPELRLGVLRPWQLCSGFAHGRPWAVYGASYQHRTEDEDPDMVNVRLSSSLATVLYPTLAAVDLVTMLLRLLEERSRGV